MPRAGLSREKVVDAGTAVADDVGFDRLSLAAVAERVGVRLPSLYKHIESLDGLRRDVTVRALEELAAALGPAVAGRSHGDALRGLADAYRDYGRRHAGRYAATVRAPDPGDERHAAAAERVLRVVNAVLRGYGLAGDDSVDAARALRASLHGFVVLETSGGFGLPRAVDRSFDRLVSALDAALSHWPSSAPEGGAPAPVDTGTGAGETSAPRGGRHLPGWRDEHHAATDVRVRGPGRPEP